MPPRGARARALEVASRLGEIFPGRTTDLSALVHDNPYELLAATILSAQCTDERVNIVTPNLLRRYPTPADLAGADPSDVEEIVRSTGFFRAKTQSLIGMATGVVERFGGEIPRAMEDLVTLPGVGRKTANVIRSVAFAEPGLPVDTHVLRVSKRLGLTDETDPVAVERDLSALLPPEEWGAMSLRVILHGRRTCKARKPDCANCPLADICPFARTGLAAAKVPSAKKAVPAARITPVKKAVSGKKAVAKAAAGIRRGPAGSTPAE